MFVLATVEPAFGPNQLRCDERVPQLSLVVLPVVGPEKNGFAGNHKSSQGIRAHMQYTAHVIQEQHPQRSRLPFPTWRMPAGIKLMPVPIRPEKVGAVQDLPQPDSVEAQLGSQW